LQVFLFSLWACCGAVGLVDRAAIKLN